METTETGTFRGDLRKDWLIYDVSGSRGTVRPVSFRLLLMIVTDLPFISSDISGYHILRMA